MNSIVIFFISLLIFLFFNFPFLSAQNTGRIELPVRPYTPTEGEELIEVPFKIFFSKEDEEAYYKDYTPVIIPEYFLLGTLTDSYRGRFFQSKRKSVRLLSIR